MRKAGGPGVGVRRRRVGKEGFGDTIWKRSGGMQSKGGDSRHVVGFLRSPYSAVNNFVKVLVIRYGGVGGEPTQTNR